MVSHVLAPGLRSFQRVRADVGGRAAHARLAHAHWIIDLGPGRRAGADEQRNGHLQANPPEAS